MVIVSVSCVRIGDAEARKDVPLQRLHRLRFMIRLVIVTEEMQGTVHHHMTPVIAERLALLRRLIGHDGRANDDIAEQRPIPWRHEPGVACREREYVGRLVLVAVVAVQGLHLACIDDAYRNIEVPARARGADGVLDPLADISRNRNTRGVTSCLHVDGHCTKREALIVVVIVRLVGGNDTLHQRMAHNVLLGEERKADSVDVFQYAHGIVEAGLLS